MSTCSTARAGCARQSEATEVGDGLLEGDEIAVAGAQGLWLAELQAVKGGVGCADGH